MPPKGKPKTKAKSGAKAKPAVGPSSFRQNPPHRADASGFNRHKLSLEMLSDAIKRTPGPKPSDTRMAEIKATVNSPDNFHDGHGTIKTNMIDRKADNKVRKAASNGETVNLTTRESNHIKPAIIFVQNNRKALGPGIANNLVKTYSCARNSKGLPLMRQPH